MKYYRFLAWLNYAWLNIVGAVLFVVLGPFQLLGWLYGLIIAAFAHGMEQADEEIERLGDRMSIAWREVFLFKK